MQIKSGLIYLTKEEKAEFVTLMQHIQTDLNWYENGSYGDGSKPYTKEIKQSENALNNLIEILKQLVI